MNDSPELNIAKRVSDKFKINPPIDVLELASRYARVEIVNFPVNLDGVCLNLKLPGKRPTIILNKRKPEKRRRFTLAHEIGHVLIPWHVGTIVDEIDILNDGNDLSYWELEGEANRFAAELLMPNRWLKKLIRKESNPAQTFQNVVDVADVSADAALIQIINSLGPGYVYAVVNADGFVISSNRSDGTMFSRLSQGTRLDEVTGLAQSDHEWRAPLRDGSCVWWHFPSRRKLSSKNQDEREWRHILDTILDELSIEVPDIRRIKQSINGIFGFSNSVIKRNISIKSLRGRREALNAAFIQRLAMRASDDALLSAVMAHRDFGGFLARRIRDLTSE